MTDKLDAIPGSTGRKIIDGLKDAVAGNFASVTIEGQRWVRADAPGARTSRWRYEIQDGPEGEFKNAEFARVFDDKGALVGTVKLHHAFMIVGSINNDELVKIETPPIPPILQREWMAQALFEVDAPDHLEWEDVGIDKRERYLCLADAAIRRNNTCP